MEIYKEVNPVLMNIRKISCRKTVHAQDDRQRFLDYLAYRQGKLDGYKGVPVGSLSEVYVEGYALGRAIAARRAKRGILPPRS